MIATFLHLPIDNHHFGYNLKIPKIEHRRLYHQDYTVQIGLAIIVSS